MRRKPPLINKTAATGSLVSDIDDLGDVVITSAANGDLLQFNGTNWVDVAQVSDGNVPESAVTQHEAAIDHDALTNFVAAEHIDWSVTGAEDIHVDRIAAGAVTQHQAALSITESQISDLSHTTDHGALTGLADNDHPQYALLASANTFTGNPIRLENTVPIINLYETDGPTQEKDWTVVAQSGQFSIRAREDDGVVNNIALAINRTGATVDEIELNATTLDFNGAADFSGAVDIGGALTAASYGGISEANLLDKTASEAITGSWTFTDGNLNVSGANASIANNQNAASFALLFGPNFDSAANPIIWGFDGDHASLPGHLRFTVPTGGDYSFRVLANEIVNIDSGGVKLLNGTAAAPAYSFTNDNDTGMYWAASAIRFANAGANIATLYSQHLRLESGTTLSISETGAANSDLPGYGQVWVHNDTPNTLWFTDDAGNDHHVAGGQLTENFGAAKPDAEDVTSSTTFQEDDDLVIDIQSGFTYQFTAVLEVASFSNTPNFKFRFSFPTGSSGSYHVVAYDPVDPSVATPVYAKASNALAFSHTIPLDSTNPGVIAGLAVVVVTGFVTAGANGEFAVEWAQATSSGTATTLRTGSTLQLNRG